MAPLHPGDGYAFDISEQGRAASLVQQLRHNSRSTGEIIYKMSMRLLVYRLPFLVIAVP